MIPRAAVYALVALALVAILGAVVLNSLPRTTPLPNVYGVFWMHVVMVVVFALVGAAIARRRPGNAVGWILLGGVTVGALSELAGAYADYALRELGGALPGGEWAAWLAAWTILCFLGPISTYLFLVFPDGRLPSPRWRPVAWYTAGALVLVPVLVALLPGPLAPTPYVVNPLWPGVRGTLLDQMGFRPFYPGVPAAILCAAALVQRFRHAQGVERQQLKWMAYAGAMVALGVALLLPLATPDRKPLQVIQMATVLLIPMAAGIAILRYRLYDIDVLINRTLVYGALSAALAATYFVAVLTFETVLHPFTAGSELSVALSTLAVVALFTPLRARLQQFVDRRFYRQRYDATRTLDAFSVRLRDEIDLDALRGGLLAAVGDTMQPVHASLWLRR